MLHDFETLPKLIAEEWETYAEATSAWEYLDEMRKTELARLSSLHEWSEALKERMARQDPEYKKFCKQVREQRKQSLKSKARLDALKFNFEYHRSKESTRREEMKMV